MFLRCFTVLKSVHGWKQLTLGALTVCPVRSSCASRTADHPGFVLAALWMALAHVMQ